MKLKTTLRSGKDHRKGCSWDVHMLSHVWGVISSKEHNCIDSVKEASGSLIYQGTTVFCEVLADEARS